MSVKPLVLVGAGGFGREVLWQLQTVNERTRDYDVLGFVDDNPQLAGGTVAGLPVLGGLDWLLTRREQTAVVLCVGSAKARRSIYETLRNNPALFYPTIVADDVRMSDSVTYGQGCIFCLSNVFTVDISIGDFVIANLDCTIGHDAVIGDFVTLYPSVNVSGATTLGSGVEIGTGAAIIQGLTIGDGTIVGAGAVVVKDLPAHCTAVGSPAKPIKFHEDE